MAKWDIKDGFWRLDCEEGEEWNFAYVLPNSDGHSTKLVIPDSLQLGYIKSPPYFCVISKTGWDVAEQYIETPIGSKRRHKFLAHTERTQAYQTLSKQSTVFAQELRYLVKVYMDDYIRLATTTSPEQLDHVANGIMCGIHDVFPPNVMDDKDPILLKKLIK